MRGLSIIQAHDVSWLDELLLNGPYMRLWHSNMYDVIPPESLRLWCHLNARYGLPTTELIHWLRELIGNQKCIEIGAGHGDLGAHLGLLQTDSKQQDTPFTKKIYDIVGAPRIKYPSHIRKLDALDAVIKYEPEVVIASWVTQFIDATEDPKGMEANMWGVKEDEILKRVKTYVLIGNENIHGTKKILSLPHETYYFPWLKSRATHPEKNLIYVWRN